MATDRQSVYLRDLGVETRARLERLSKEVAPEWIEELKGYTVRAGLPVGQRLTEGVLRSLGARPDALSEPPGHPVSEADTKRQQNPPGASGGPVRTTSPADESWWKLEVELALPLGPGRTARVAMSGSEHRRHGLSLGDAEALSERVREALERELRRLEGDPAWTQGSARADHGPMPGPAAPTRLPPVAGAEPTASRPSRGSASNSPERSPGQGRRVTPPTGGHARNGAAHSKEC